MILFLIRMYFWFLDCLLVAMLITGITPTIGIYSLFGAEINTDRDANRMCDISIAVGIMMWIVGSFLFVWLAIR